MVGQQIIYRLYTRRLRGQLAGGPLPRHVGIIMDGNRRWARQQGMANPSLGHKYGAEHIENLLTWCQRAGIKHVTVFLCSTENIANRGDAEVAFLMDVIEQVVARQLSRDPAWQVHIAGDLDALPDTTARALKEAVEASRDCATGAHVTLAVGYGGRQELIDAVRALLCEQADNGATLAELAETITAADIARHLYTAGQPDPDLVIRTSGEMRLSNFLLWPPGSAATAAKHGYPAGVLSRPVSMTFHAHENFLHRWRYKVFARKNVFGRTMVRLR
jgi:short-chain Z-isoprenyl diphosphate synthase